MENFIVSARKYRPATFTSVIGQASITKTLKNAIKTSKLAQAYLFCGPRGVGKTTCARIFAKTINCQNISSETEPCNECESCISFNENRSYNIHELDAASNNSVDDIRILIEKVRIPPQIGKYSIYIIDEVHMLSSSAFNAFLKTLEEPPKHAVFILATTEKHKIIPTILSRCQIFDFNRIMADDTVKYLEYIANNEKVEFETEALSIIAQKADGGMRDALSIFDQLVSFTDANLTYQNVIENLNVLDYEYYFKMVTAFTESNIQEALLLFNEILNKGFDGHQFITGLSSHLRDLLVSKDTQTIKLLEVSKNIAEQYQVQAQNTETIFILDALEITSKCDISYKQAKNQRLHVELTLIQLANLLKKKAELEKKTAEIKEEEKIESQKDSKKAETEKYERPVNLKKPSMKSDSVPSIKDLAKKTGYIHEKGPKEDVLEEGEKNTSFTLDTFKKVWMEYAETLKEESPRLYHTLHSLNYSIKDFEIEFTISNSLLEKAVIDKTNEILRFLRQNLHNDKITLVTKVSEIQEEGTIIYTSEDKFKHLAKKNPKLLDLKKDLNLDFD